LRFLHLAGLAAWFGALVFFSFVAAPALFGALPREAAGRAVSAIFPRYYLFGAACGVVALAARAGLCLLRGAWSGVALTQIISLTLMLVLTLYAGTVVLPRAAQARAALADAPAGDVAAQAAFGALHRRSVLLNATVLLLGMIAVGALAARPDP
jgi:hypothetical protein